MKTLRNLLESEDHKKVFAYLCKKGPMKTMDKVKSAYSLTINELMDIPPQKPNMPFHVSRESDWLNKKNKFIDVKLLNKNFKSPAKGKWDPQNLNHCKYWGCSFSPWKTLIDSEVINKAKLDNVAILAEILWEITFNGYTQKTVRKKLGSLQREIKKIKQNKTKLVTLVDGDKKKGQWTVKAPKHVAKKLKKILSGV